MTWQYSFTETDINFIHDALCSLIAVINVDDVIHESKDLVITRLTEVTDIIESQIKAPPKVSSFLNEYYKLADVLEELKAISQRENKRHMMDQHLTPSMLALVEDEIIPMLENEMDYEPSDEELGYGGEPPMTADEMHIAAWRQHQELHS